MLSSCSHRNGPAIRAPWRKNWLLIPWVLASPKVFPWLGINPRAVEVRQLLEYSYPITSNLVGPGGWFRAPLPLALSPLRGAFGDQNSPVVGFCRTAVVGLIQLCPQTKTPANGEGFLFGRTRRIDHNAITFRVAQIGATSTLIKLRNLDSL